MSSPSHSHQESLLTVPPIPITRATGPAQPTESVRPLNILLVMPRGNQEEDSGQKPLFTMAIGVLASITPPQHHLEIADDLFGDEIPYDGNYDLVGVTTRTLNATRAYEIADEFKKRGTPVVIGGVHVSFNYDEAAPHCDSVIIGEADGMWATIIEHAAQGKEKLLPYYFSGDFPPVTEAPMIDYERIFKASKREKVDARKSIPIYISRGCPYTCSFCVTPNFTGKLYRIQTPEAIVQQIEQAKQVFFKKTRYGDKPWFMFTDENLGVNKKKLWDILEAVKGCNIRFSSFISLNFLEDPKTVRLLVDAGCVMVLVGFESINDETLKLYNKSRQNSVEKFIRIIRQCREAGLCVQGNFLTNPAVDSFADMDAVEAFVRKNHIVMPIYSLITPYPGTAMYWEYKEKGLVVDEDWDKYTAANLVVKSERFDPLEYQIKFLEHYLAMYSWKTIFTRVMNNSNKLINLVTSIYFKRNLADQLKNVREGRRRPVEQTIADTKAEPQMAAIEVVKG